MFYDICKLVYYSFGILAILFELIWLKEPMKIPTKSKLIAQKKKEGLPLTSNENNYLNLNLLYVIWIAVGFISSQWLFFIGIILVTYLIPSKYLVTSFLKSLITLLLLVAIYLNTFHFHIDLTELIKSKF